MIEILILVVVGLVAIHLMSHSDNIDGTTTPRGLFDLWGWMKSKVKGKDEE
jgi:hypothetical protein